MHADVGLVQRALAGDEDARRTIVERCQGTIRYVITSMLGARLPREHVEDAIQEVWVALHEALPSFEGRSSVRTFSARIARYQALGYWKRLHPGRESLIDPQDPALQAMLEGDDLPDPELDVEARDLYIQVEQRLMTRLNQREQLVYRLFFVDGCSPDQVAELAGATVNNVYQIVFRTRQLARQIRDRVG